MEELIIAEKTSISFFGIFSPILMSQFTLVILDLQMISRLTFFSTQLRARVSAV